MPDDSLPYLTIREVGARLRQRDLSPVELTEAILARIERLDGTLNAYIIVMREQALEQARRAERALADGDDLSLIHI